MLGLMAALLLGGAAHADVAAKVNLLARKHLAARLKIRPAQIETSAMRPMVWPDTSLGCPKPGLSYAQVQTPGYLIELKAKGRTWTYHSDQRRAVPCETLSTDAKPGNKSRIVPGEPPPPQTGPVDK